MGNLVFYTVNGKTYVRTKPGKERRRGAESEAAKQCIWKCVALWNGDVECRKEHLGFPLTRDAYNKAPRIYAELICGTLPGYVLGLVGENSGMCQLNALADIRDIFRKRYR